MGTQAYRYRFREDVDILDTEVTLHLAIIAAEGLYGEARVRMDAATSSTKRSARSSWTPRPPWARLSARCSRTSF